MRPIPVLVYARSNWVDGGPARPAAMIDIDHQKDDDYATVVDRAGRIEGVVFTRIEVLLWHGDFQTPLDAIVVAETALDKTQRAPKAVAP